MTAVTILYFIVRVRREVLGVSVERDRKDWEHDTLSHHCPWGRTEKLDALPQSL
jgi:hypothetical protein